MDGLGTLDLSGPWRATEGAGDLNRRFAEPAFDDRDWAVLDVPGHWRSHPAFASSDGPVLHRRTFGAVAPGDGARAFVAFEGVFYYGDVWLDGTYLGATEGYFFPHHLEVTEQLRASDEHLLAVEVACPSGGRPGLGRAITGVFADLDANPGGIWRPVHLFTTGPVRLARVRALCVEASEERGRIALALTLDAATEADTQRRREPLPARITVRVDDDLGRTLTERTVDASLAEGENHLTVDVDVDRPLRWWPRSLGPQPLCELNVRVHVGDEVSDERTLRTAFRDVRLRRSRLTVNGAPMFVRSTSQGPSRVLLGEATSADLRRDVELALDANMNMLRVHEHVSSPELYDAADEAGLLLWQDLPMRGRYARTARGQAVRQAVEMVDRLGHHPSIAVWCAHDLPFSLAGEDAATRSGRAREAASHAASMLLPSWNKDVLDRSVARALHRADATRPVVAHSGVPPRPLAPGTGAHLVGGWHDGMLDGLATTAKAWPRLTRFVGAFGAPAVPDAPLPVAPRRWPDREWVDAVSAGPYGSEGLAELVGPELFATYGEWAAATRERQAALVQLATEDLRRLKGRPTVGYCHFCLADPEPGVTCAVVDHRREPKPAFAALRDASRPVLAMLEPRSGAVHVVNDTADHLLDASVTVKGVPGHHHAWSGEVRPDAVVFVGRAPAIAQADGDVLVTLEHPSIGVVENRYRAAMLRAVARDARAHPLSMLKRTSAG